MSSSLSNTNRYHSKSHRISHTIHSKWQLSAAAATPRAGRSTVGTFLAVGIAVRILDHQHVRRSPGIGSLQRRSLSMLFVAIFNHLCVDNVLLRRMI